MVLGLHSQLLRSIEIAGDRDEPRSARFSSPLGVYDFQKRTSMLKVSKESAQALGLVAAELAWGEGLAAHARAAELRMQPVPKPRY